MSVLRSSFLTLMRFVPSESSVITVTPSGANSWPSSSYCTTMAVSRGSSTIAPGRIFFLMYFFSPGSPMAARRTGGAARLAPSAAAGSAPNDNGLEKSTFSRALIKHHVAFTSSRAISYVGGRRENGCEAPPTSTSRRACARRTLLAAPPCSTSLPRRWRAGCATGASARLATGTRTPPWTR